jgi:hypothetical protein
MNKLTTSPDSVIEEIIKVFEESNRVLDKKLKLLHDTLSPYLEEKHITLSGFDGSMPFDGAVVDQMLIIGHTIVQSPDCYHVASIDYSWVTLDSEPRPTFQFRIREAQSDLYTVLSSIHEEQYAFELQLPDGTKIVQ